MQRKKYSAELKAKIALEAIKGLKTINEIAGEYGVHPKLIEPEHHQISLKRQCELVGLPRSSWYYQPATETTYNEHLMKLIDRQFTEMPYYGVRKMTEWLKTQGEAVNVKRVRRLMRKMGLEAIYPKPNLSKPGDNLRRYPYLLKEVVVKAPNQVWSTDITYIPMPKGFVYLVAVMDWFSRYVLSWQISNTMDVGFCLEALEDALKLGKPEVFNSDQGAQFTSEAFTSRLEEEGIRISQDGRGRAFDNIFVERLWRSVKYEEVYLKSYTSVMEAMDGLGNYFETYNQRRLHQALNYQTPAHVHFC